jgi:hypothetical protein
MLCSWCCLSTAVSWGVECAGRWFTGQIVECRCAVNRLWSWAGFVTRTTSPVSGRSALHYAMASGDCAVVRTVATAMRDGARKRELISSSRLGVVSGPGKSDHPPPTPTPPPSPCHGSLSLHRLPSHRIFVLLLSPWGRFQMGQAQAAARHGLPGRSLGTFTTWVEAATGHDHHHSPQVVCGREQVLPCVLAR